MEIKIETSNYNDRRYGKPWIARVDFTSGKPDYQWGDWIGTPGYEGVLTIKATPGDIIARGQKDNRNPRNSAPSFFVVTPNGEIEPLGDKGNAYKYYLAHKDNTPDKPTLEKEKEMLLTRLTEIDTLLNSIEEVNP